MRRDLLSLVWLTLTAAAAHAEVASETIVFLQPDGRSYLMQRGLRTTAPRHSLLVDKTVRLDDLRHVTPQEFTWDDSPTEYNRLSFATGIFTVIYPGLFTAAELGTPASGQFEFSSWDGTKRADGHFGMWYAPGDFDQFTYSWVLPEGWELLHYQANRPGSWVRRGQSVTWYGTAVNDLAFTLSYRQGSGSSAPTTAVPRQGGTDADGDGTPGDRDLCPNTPPGAEVDQAGCPLDTDKDGVPDGIDRCLRTREGTPVDARGCRMGSGPS